MIPVPTAPIATQKVVTMPSRIPKAVSPAPSATRPMRSSPTRTPAARNTSKVRPWWRSSRGNMRRAANRTSSVSSAVARLIQVPVNGLEPSRSSRRAQMLIAGAGPLRLLIHAAGEEAAIDHDDLTADEAGRFRGQEHRRAGQLADLAETPHRRALLELLAAR